MRPNLLQLVRLYSTRGKKLKPEKPTIVVLNPKQAGLLNNRNRYRPSNPNNEGRNFSDNNTSIQKNNGSSRIPSKNTLFEGVELEPARTKKPPVLNETLSENLLKDTENLLKFSKNASLEQLFYSIDSLKPAMTNISQENYTELQEKIMNAFTIKQLRAYINKLDPNHDLITSNRLVKHKLIDQIFTKLWDSKISQNLINLKTKTIKLTERHSKLLLLTQNGKILKNLTRLNPHLFIQLNLSQNELRITSTSDILEFIEISLNNILNNVCTKQWEPQTSLTDNQLNLITRICGVDINNNEIAAFGWKRIDLAKRLVRWIISQEDSIYKNTKYAKWLKSDQPDTTDKNIRLFPYSDPDRLDWISKNEEWGRLQKVESMKNENNKCSFKVNDIITEEKIDEVYDFFRKSNRDSNKSEIPQEVSQIISVSFGSVLETKNNNMKIFQPVVPKISEKVLALPVDTEEYDSEPSYYLELNFISTPHNSVDKKFPPIKLLLQLDENNNIIYETIQCLTTLSTNEYYAQTPQLPHDYKISNDILTDIFEYDAGGNLINQPSVDKFLDKFVYKPYLPSDNSIYKILFNLPSAGTDLTTVDYSFVSMNHHSVKRFKYLNKYSVQFSKVNGNSLGGDYTQVEFVNNDNATELPNREEFGQFMKDIFNFEDNENSKEKVTLE